MTIMQSAHCNDHSFITALLITYGCTLLKVQVIVVQVVYTQLRDVELVEVEVPEYHYQSQVQTEDVTGEV
jgi:hypothetical protein